MQWWRTLDAVLMGAAVPTSLGDRIADVHWAGFDDETRTEWWAAWSGTVRADDPIPLEPWRAAVVAAVVRRAAPRRRLTWIAALVTAVLGVTVISVGSIIPPDLRMLVDVMPLCLAVLLIAGWDEWGRHVYAGRCHNVAGMDLQDEPPPNIGSRSPLPPPVQSPVRTADR